MGHRNDATPDPTDDRWVSVSRASYVEHPLVPTVTHSPARREAERVRARLASGGPCFSAMSNYDLSYTGLMKPPSSICRPEIRSPLQLPFVETSTHRANYTPLPIAVSSKRPRGQSPHRRFKDGRTKISFTASSISRESYVRHSLTKVPERKHETMRVLPKIKFTAISTHAASYQPPLLRGGESMDSVA